MKAQTTVSTGCAVSKTTLHAQEEYTASLGAKREEALYSGTFRKNRAFISRGKRMEILRRTSGEPTEGFPPFQINLQSSRKEVRQ